MIERARSIVGIMLIISVLSGVFLFWGINRYKKTMDSSIIETTTKAQKIFAQIIKNTNLVYDFQINNILKNKEIVNAFRKRDRQALYTAMLPDHLLLKKENPYYSNMHFHLPDGHSFLRMHKPEQFGDDLKKLRPVITHTHVTYEAKSGYEIGKHGLFYRVVKPVFVNKTYIGALEVGIKVNEVADNIESVLDVKVARYISSSLVNKDYKKLATNELLLNGFLLNPYENSDLFNPVAKTYNFKAQESEFVENNEKHYLLFSAGELNTFENKPLARFLVVQEVTKELHEYQAYIIKSVILTILLILSAFLILYFSFGSMINKIMLLNKSLEKKVKERTQQLEDASFKLHESNAELDQIFNTAADGMRVIGVDFRVLRVNDTFSAITGLPKDKLENNLCHECFQGPYCFTEECTLRRILKGEEHIELDVKRRSMGIEKSFLLTATPYKSLEGDILGVVENFKDMTDRNNAFDTVKEKEEYLNAVMETVQAGVIVTDHKTLCITDINPYAEELIGANKEIILNKPVTNYFKYETSNSDTTSKPSNEIVPGDCLLIQETLGKRHIRLKTASVIIKGERYKVLSFIDITDVKRLLENQAVDIIKSKGIMTLINREPSCYIDLPNNARLFCSSISVPCNAEGGDHLFIHNLPSNNGTEGTRTVISLKDQSGHEVNCILRSIYTDLIHGASLANNPDYSLDQTIGYINKQLCHSGYFENDDFFTSINAEINHESLKMTWLSTGHPPFLLIRNGKVSSIPEPGSSGCNLPVPFLPEASFKSEMIQLQKDDQMIFYTDGLTDMPIGNKYQPLTTEELVKITQSLIDDHFNKIGKQAAISTTTENLFNTILEISGNSIEVGNDINSLKSSSIDDVTLIAVQIESNNDSMEMVITHDVENNISDQTAKVFQSITETCDLASVKEEQARVKIVLEEAIINAWKHGNEKSAEKTISIKWKQENGLLVEVIDQGKGFNFRSRPDPTLSENILSPSGRGLYIINNIADRVWWRNKGSHINIFFHRTKMSTETIFKKTDSLWGYSRHLNRNIIELRQ